MSHDQVEPFYIWHWFCSLFKVPTINQETAVAGSEPTETLTKFRSDKAVRPNKKQQGKVRSNTMRSSMSIKYYQALRKITSILIFHVILQVYFGQNMVCSDALSRGKGKIIKVGDPVYVLKVVPSSAEAPAWTQVLSLYCEVIIWIKVIGKD